MSELAISFLGHLRELRTRIIRAVLMWVVCSLAAYFFYTPILDFISQPLKQIIHITHTPQLFYVNTLLEGFSTRINFSMVCGLVFSFPFLLYQLLRFIFPGLKPRERKVVLWAVFSSSFLAIFSFYFAYTQLLPYSVRFLMDLDFIPHQVGILLKFDHSLFHVMNFLFYSILAFQFPVVLEILLYLNIVSRQTLLSKSRYAIVLIFIVSAIVTPPDVISQCGVALPMIALFYTTILIAKIFKFGE